MSYTIHRATSGPGAWTYAPEVASTTYPLSEDEVIARLREQVFYEHRHHHYYRLKADRLSRELTTPREALADATASPLAAEEVAA